MKKLYVLIFVATSLLSCKGWLDETPKSLVTKDNAFKTEADAEAAIIGVYNSLGRDYYDIFYYLLEELHGDYLTGRGTQAPISTFDMILNQMSADRAGACWEKFYMSINRANAVLDNVSGMNIDEGLKTRVLGEAYFLRAMAYFNLVRAWGPVPIRIHEVVDEKSLPVARSPKADVFKLIETDLTIAEQNLPDDVGTETGKASKWAAKMLLAQAYLDQEKWDECAAKSMEVIDSGQYSLVPVSVPEEFYNLYNHDTSVEDIMSLHHSVTRRAELTFYLHAPGTPPWNPSGSEGVYAWLPYTEGRSIIGTRWSDKDLRKSFNLYTQYQNSEGVWVNNSVNPTLFKKFIPTPEGVASNTVPIFRYAETLLMYAEAACMGEAADTSGEAWECLNMVRRRAYGHSVDSPSVDDYPKGMSVEDFREAVLMERAYEFLLERRRWWDLKRTGSIEQAFADVGKRYIEERLLWPIPLGEIQNNPLIGPENQNPGY
jgi:hypothetical protein